MSRRNRSVTFRHSNCVLEETALGVILVVLAAAASPLVDAALSQSENKRLETGKLNEAGPTTSSPTSGRRTQVSVGHMSETIVLRGNRFRLNAGFLAAATAGSQTTAPPDLLDLTAVYAKTDPFGVKITPQEWQRDTDPIFFWDPPATGLDIAGYSVMIDGEPDETVDTSSTSWNIASQSPDHLSDGSHVFKVKAVNSAGNSGKAASFEIRIDTTPPVINSYAPQPGALLNSLSLPITATISDVGSGVGASGLTLLVNGSSVQLSIDQATGAITASGAGMMREGTNRFELRAADRVGNALAPLLWSATVDATPPQGSVFINAGASMTTSVYVTLTLSASDEVSGVSAAWISNDPVIGYVREPFVPIRELWRLVAVRGTQPVYVKFEDGAGNVSLPVSDDIDLVLLAPETLILSGPAGVTPERKARFTFGCSEEEGCVFSYAIDHEAWSAWSSEASMTQENLTLGNHYFKVKAAKDVNGIPGIQLDEEDPTPAERTWVIGVEAPVQLVPRGTPIKLWQLE